MSLGITDVREPPIWDANFWIWSIQSFPAFLLSFLSHLVHNLLQHAEPSPQNNKSRGRWWGDKSLTDPPPAQNPHTVGTR